MQGEWQVRECWATVDEELSGRSSGWIGARDPACSNHPHLFVGIIGPALDKKRGVSRAPIEIPFSVGLGRQPKADVAEVRIPSINTAGKDGLEMER